MTQEEGDKLAVQDRSIRSVIKAEIATKDISLHTTTKPLPILVMIPLREAC